MSQAELPTFGFLSRFLRWRRCWLLRSVGPFGRRGANQPDVPAGDHQAAPRARRWLGVFRSEVLVGIVVFLLCNAAIAGFVSVARHRREATQIQSAQAKQLGQYYVELGSFLNTQLPRNGSDADVAKWQDALVAEARRDPGGADKTCQAEQECPLHRSTRHKKPQMAECC